MDSDFDRKFTAEVLYLHSLWRQGPSGNPTIQPNGRPFGGRKRPNEHKNGKGKNKKSCPNPPKDPGPEWPVPEPVPKEEVSTPSGWPSFNPSSTTPVQPVSSEERAKLAALQLQRKQLEVCREFLSRNAVSGSDEEEGNDGSSDDDDDDESKGNEEYNFFVKLFEENNELRSYYLENSETGCFCCLVCCRMGRKFRSCLGLVRHSMAISKTKKKRAHRAFGRAICKVFGWDINRLPTIVLNGEPLGRPLADSGNSKIQTENKNDSDVQKEGGESLNDTNSQKIELISKNCGSNNTNSVDGEEERKPRDSQPNAKDLVSVEVLTSIMEACKEFFAGSSYSKIDDDGSGDNLKDGAPVEETKEFKFFLELFTKNEELRSYYVNKYENGEFSCLVCGAAAAGSGRILKKYKTCYSLLQHSTARAPRAKTKHKLAHQAYSLVMCKVLGWDIEKLPFHQSF